MNEVSLSRDLDICRQHVAWLEAEIERVKRDGTPGIMHPADQAFYNLTVRERDYERVRADRLERELEAERTRGLRHIMRERDEARADQTRRIVEWLRCDGADEVDLSFARAIEDEFGGKA